MQTNRLTFIVPGLIDPVPYLDQLPAQELPDLPVFSTLLSRAKCFIPDSPDDSDNSYYACLMKEFGVQNLLPQFSPDSPLQPLPIASICYCYDTADLSDNEKILDIASGSQLKEQWIMRVDPCFMAPDRDQLVMAEMPNLDISLAEAQQLVDAINHFFLNIEEENFWTLRAVSPERWYIVSEKPIRLQSVPPEKVLGQSVKPFLFNKKSADGEFSSAQDSSHWLNLFHEFQMILHQSPVNKQRTEQGKLPVNSLWFWGAGQVLDCSALIQDLSQELTKESTQEQTQSLTTVYTDDVFVKGLAHLKKQTICSLPDKYQPFANKEGERAIYIINDFMRAINNKDIFSWVGLLQQFESHYLIPLIKELKTGKIAEIEFVSPSGKRLLLTKKLFHRWWRKKEPYFKLLSNS